MLRHRARGAGWVMVVNAYLRTHGGGVMSLERGAVGGGRRLRAGGRRGWGASSARVSVEDVHVRDAASVVVLVQLCQERGAP